MNVLKMMSKDYRNEQKVIKEINDNVYKLLCMPVWKRRSSSLVTIGGVEALFRASLKTRTGRLFVRVNEQWMLVSITKVKLIPGAPATFTPPVTHLTNKELAKTFFTIN